MNRGVLSKLHTQIPLVNKRVGYHSLRALNCPRWTLWWRRTSQTRVLHPKSLLNLNNDLRFPSHDTLARMEAARIAQYFSEQEKRMNDTPDESRDDFIARLARTRPQLGPSFNEAGHQQNHQAAQSEERPESHKPTQKQRHHDLESKGTPYENKALECASEPAPCGTHSPGSSLTPNSSSVKRKSSDHESGLLQDAVRPGKKIRRHRNGDGVPDLHGRSAAAPSVLTTTHQSEDLVEGAGSSSRHPNSRPDSERGRPAKAELPRDTAPEKQKGQQQSRAFDSVHAKMKETPPLSNSDGGMGIRNSKAAAVRGRVAGVRSIHTVSDAGISGEKVSASSKPRVAAAATTKSVISEGANAAESSSKSSRQSSKTPRSATSSIKAAGSLAKPPLVIPRYSDIKRTKKDGTSRAPVDISLATQRVGERRRKIEDKTLCDTGPIQMGDFIDRLYQFYDEEEMNRRSSKSKFLAGHVVFFCPSEYPREIGMGARKKLQALATHGATLLPAFDQERVTHIIVQESVKEPSQLLSRLKLKSIDDIPKRIPVLRWEWVDVSWKKRAAQPVHEYPAFKTRVTYASDYAPLSPPPDADDSPGPSRKASTSRAQPEPMKHDDQEDSNSSGDEHPLNDVDDTHAVPLENQRSKHGSQKPRTNNPSDPLAEFYDQARDEIDMEYLHGRGRHGQDGEESAFGSREEKEGEEEDAVSEPRGAGEDEKKGIFQCDNVKKPSDKRQQSCPNQDVIDTLAELKALHEAKGTTEDKWRVFAYSKMLGPIRSYPKRIESEQEARGIRGVGEKTAKKIMEIIRTGGLRRISYERTQDVHIVMAFQGIYGVGQKTAYQWYVNGCRSLDDVREGRFDVKLSSAQKIGLEFYDDINSRIPRNEAKEIFGIIKTIALQMDPHLFIEIMGSYRRGKETCGDIDILITRPTSDGKTHVGVLARLFDELHVRGIITEDLSIPEDWHNLELVYRGLCRKDATSKRRRIDFLTVPYESRGAALLYYTGDDIFNRSMRLKANKMGYSLNQRGLYKDVIRDPSNRMKKLHDGTILASETEREIFDALGVPWQEPHERVRN